MHINVHNILANSKEDSSFKYMKYCLIIQNECLLLINYWLKFDRGLKKQINNKELISTINNMLLFTLANVDAKIILLR